MKKLFYTASILLAITLFAADTVAQVRERLNSNWEFVKYDLGGIWEAVRPVAAGAPESLPIWEKVTLPHCVNAKDAVDPDVNYYQGPAWYRTQLQISNPFENGRTLLHFEGSGQKTTVYVHTTEVGSHVGGYDEWTVDLTDAIAAFKKTEAFTKQFKGKIPLSIRTDNSRDLELIPSDLSDFNVYGGLYRYVNLVYEHAVSVDQLFAKAITTAAGKTGKIEVRASFYNPGQVSGAQLTVEVRDPKNKVVGSFTSPVSAFDNCQMKTIDIKDIVLWSTETPALYTVNYSVTTGGNVSKGIEKVGFRHIDFTEKGPFLLNGKRILLKGTHRHEDHAGVAAAMTEEQMREEMIMMKDMGVNFIRLGHYQQSRIILELCDSLGIMVWEEIPWCRGGLGGEKYKEQARRMLRNMIRQHFNHPSVIIWGLGNENDWPGDFSVFDKEQIRTFMKELNDISHQEDPSRYTAIRRCEFCADIVDVYSPSIWAGWYRGVYTDYKKASEDEFKKVKRFLHVEWGGDSHAGRNSENPDNALRGIKGGSGADERAGDASLIGGAARVSKDGDWSESYICNLIDWHLKEQETMPWLTGTAYWPFKDFSTPIRPENPVPYMNQKGVVERDFTKKEAYYVFQSYWTTRPMARIYGHNWPVRWGASNEEKMIKVYSNCDEAELFVNGKSMGIRKRNSQDFPAAGLRWNVIPVTGKNEIKVIARKGKQTVTDEISFEYQSEPWGKPAILKLEEIPATAVNASTKDEATVRVTLLDSAGRICLDSRAIVYFGLAGDGILLDNLGTSRGSRKVELYNGRAEITVKLTGPKSIVTVRSDKLTTAFLELHAK